MSENSALKTSNEDFIYFSFAVVSVILIVLYVPKIFKHIHELILYCQAPKKSRGPFPLISLWESCAYPVRMTLRIIKEPTLLLAGAKLAMREKMFFCVKVAPRFFSYTFRPRIFLPVLWLVLFTSVMYTTLTFDPHAILNVSRSASTTEIKKAYRGLVKKYHPDNNNTEEAKSLFIQVSRAYKALVDREAFEEENRENSEFSVGVALPRLLLSREHDGLVLFGLLAILIGLPIFFWKKMTSGGNIQGLINAVLVDASYTESFMKHFRIPEDFKYVEKKISREIILSSLVQMGVYPKNASSYALAKFPPLSDFIQRCVDSEHQKNYLEALGFNERCFPILQAYMTANREALMKKYEAQLLTISSNDNDDETFLNDGYYKVTFYFYCQHTAEVDEALCKLIEMNDNIPSAKKLLRLHEEARDNLQYIYSNGVKGNRTALCYLIQVPQRVAELVENIQQEIILLYRRQYRSELAKSISKKDMRTYKKKMTN